MVLTRSRSATPVKSVAASFRPSTKPSISSPPAAKRILHKSATESSIQATPTHATSSDSATSAAKSKKRGRSVSETLQDATPTVAKKPATTKAVEEPFVIPANANEEDCRTRTTVSFPDLPFDLEEAKRHLCSVDARFARLFEKVPVRCYEEAIEGEGEMASKELNLFKTITTSILGQQISWLAARSVLYKFCRLFFADQMPEKPDFIGFPREQWPFPTPLMVLRTSDADLRAAGLSFAKIKYVKDLAARFVDGRLDIRQILELDDEEACVTELSKIKGVGRWTSEMILMFAMRKPDILPCADLGVQKGMINFFLSDATGPRISIKKRKAGQEDDEDEKQKDQKKSASRPSKTKSAKLEEGPLEPTDGSGEQVPMLAQTEIMPKLESAFDVAGNTQKSLDHLISKEHGLCRKVLEHRVKGNKIKGGQYLSPEEMKALAKPWEPFRSVACMFLWALVDT